MARRGLDPTLKKFFDTKILFCHKEHFWFGQLRKVRSAERGTHTHPYTERAEVPVRLCTLYTMCTKTLNQNSEGFPVSKINSETSFLW